MALRVLEPESAGGDWSLAAGPWGGEDADARLGEIPLGPDGYGEAVVPVGPWVLRVTVERAPGAPGSADLFGEDPADLLGRVLRCFR